MHIEIEMRKIKDFKGFAKEGFCVSPKQWQLPYGLFVRALNEAKELAQNCQDICVAIVHDEQIGQYVLAETVPEGWEPKFVLFNAEQVSKEEGEVRVYTYNKAGVILFDSWVKYNPAELG